MSRSSYQYETSPRKYEPDYDIPRKRTQQTRRKNSTKKTTAKKQTIKTNYQIKKEKKKIEMAMYGGIGNKQDICSECGRNMK